MPRKEGMRAASIGPGSRLPTKNLQPTRIRISPTKLWKLDCMGSLIIFVVATITQMFLYGYRLSFRGIELVEPFGVDIVLQKHMHLKTRSAAIDAIRRTILASLIIIWVYTGYGSLKAFGLV